MASARLKWGIVGLGRLADGSIGPAIRESANGKLTTCCSRDLAKAQAFAQRHGGARAYDDYERMVADPEVEAIFIASPNALHAQHTIAAAQAGKHVLCEKPLATTMADGEAMVAACRANGVTLGIGLQMRFEPLYQKLRALLQGGEIGTCIEATVQRCTQIGMVPADPDDWRRQRELAGLGTLYDMGPHMFDLLWWFLGSEPRRVTALAHPPFASGQPDDASVTTIEFANGALVTVRLARDVPQPGNDFQFFGSKGAALTSGTRGVNPMWIAVRTAAGEQKHVVPAANPYLGEIEAFPRQIAGEWGPAANMDDALRLIAISEAITRSLETGQAANIAR